MEDILASIRRIIADDQSRHAQAPSHPSPPPRAVPIPSGPAAAPASPASIRREPPLNRSVLPPQRPLSRPVVESRSLATAHPGLSPHLNPPPPPIPPIVADHPVIDEIASAGVAAALRGSSAPALVLSAASEADEVTVEIEAPAFPSTAQVSAMPTQPVAMAPIEMAPPPPIAFTPKAEPDAATHEEEPADDAVAVFSPEAVPEALVSPAARATIETSFHALSASVFMQNAGMVEGLARDMLRPMLKSWLDDNLPGIVERLVRQEIERVARGGRS